MNLAQRVIVFLTFLLLLTLNLYTFSSMAILYKGMWHSLPAKAVEVRLVDSPSMEDAVPVRDQGGGPTGQVVQLEVQNSFYDRLRLLPFWNMGVLALAFVAYVVAEIIHGWRARHAT
ncbi:hypothetical protein [Xanthomonas medicagonis]|uniref:hypothetical protein n=1 Tax=Xanthomonas medicagonis TaxID=3160841 RepID=UPI0035173BBD